MASHHNVAQAWANRQNAKGSRVFTNGTTIYSYGEHFPIATHLGNNKILFNTDRYSSSTSKHQNYVARAIKEDIKLITCTTQEIRNAIECPNEPIVIIKEEQPKDIDRILELLANAIRNKGVKHFRVSKIKETIKNKILMKAI